MGSLKQRMNQIRSARRLRQNAVTVSTSRDSSGCKTSPVSVRRMNSGPRNRRIQRAITSCPDQVFAWSGSRRTTRS